MSQEHTEDGTHEDIEAYALGSLDGHERAKVETHLRGCEICRVALRDYQIALSALPAALASATAVRPDPRLRQRVIDAARRRRAPRVAGAVVAAAAVGILVLAAWNLQLSQTLAQERETYARLAGQQEIVFEVVDSPRSSKLFLRAPVSNSTAYGKVFATSDLPFVVAMAGRLPQAPADQAYHAWLTYESGMTVLAGILTVDRNGFGSVVYEADHVGPSFQSARVTLQPRGTDSPQGVPVLFWSR